MKMKIKFRILTLVVAVSILVASTILVSKIVQFSRFADSSVRDSLDRALLKVLNEVELLEDKASRIAALYFANDHLIVNAVASGNREALLNRAKQIYNETRVELCVIIDLSGRVLVRPGNPEEYGDDMSMMHSARWALTGGNFTTTEYGPTVSMAACSGAPIHDEQGRLIGAVVVGFRLDTNEFVDKHKRISGSEITIFRRDARVATTLLNEDGTRAVGIKEDEIVSRMVLAGNSYSGRTTIFGEDFLVKYIPFLNPDGEAIGMLGVGHSLREKTNTIWSFVKTGMFSTFVILAVNALCVLFITNRVTVSIEQMLNKINNDALTGVYNRRFLEENMEKIIKSLSRSEGTLTLIMIDIDYFKDYNDTYGHNKGDDCLKIVAKILEQCTTRTDDFTVRYGGDEFVAVLTNTDEAGARMIAQKLLKNVQELNMPHSNSMVAQCVTISIGITTATAAHSQSWVDYVKRADEALYMSKQKGRNQYTYLDFTAKPNV